jgi:hypothetical protein
MAVMLEAVNISETSIKLYDTIRAYVKDGCHLRTPRRENLKSH